MYLVSLDPADPYPKFVKTRSGRPMSSQTRVGSTLISVFDQLVQLPSRFCQIPVRVGRQWNTLNPSPQNPVYEHMGRRPVLVLFNVAVLMRTGSSPLFPGTRQGQG